MASITDNVVALTIPDAPAASGSLTITSTTTAILTTGAPGQDIRVRFNTGTVALGGNINSVVLQARAVGTLTWYDLPFGRLTSVLLSNQDVDIRTPLLVGPESRVLVETNAYLLLTANATADAYMIAPGATSARLVALSVVPSVTPASAAGTILFSAATGAAFATNLLSAATVDAEGFVGGTATSLTLSSGTSTDLVMSSGSAVRVRLVSNNGDAVGGPLSVTAIWELLGSQGRPLVGTIGAFQIAQNGVPTEVRLRYTRSSTIAVTGATAQVWAAGPITAG